VSRGGGWGDDAWHVYDLRMRDTSAVVDEHVANYNISLSYNIVH